MRPEQILNLAADCGLFQTAGQDNGRSPLDGSYEEVIVTFAGRLLDVHRAELSQGATDVLAERQRQISVEGWTPEHDDEHIGGELAGAATCYILNDSGWPSWNVGIAPVRNRKLPQRYPRKK